jgi:hypothetical protein
MKDTLIQSIDSYKKGDLATALELLKPLTKSAEARSAKAYYNSGAVAPNRLAPYQWISLAVDRLEKELGADVIAVMPVLMSLNNALGFCREDVHAQ